VPGRSARETTIADLRISTWNVNSIRRRLDGLAALVAAHAPDVICLQETKVAAEAFPREACADLGYPHQVIAGFKGRNGVAILAREALADGTGHDWCDRADGRHVAARLGDGIEVHSLYVPAGGDEPDPERNPRFAHKLRFLAELTNWFAARKAPLNRFVLTGDLNIAPLEADVWNHAALVKVVSHTPVEVAALARLEASHDWTDAVRRLVPAPEKVYSWWSYRARDWRLANRGRRLDHVWVTPALAEGLAAVAVLTEARDWEGPSDHVPVTVTMARS